MPAIEIQGVGSYTAGGADVAFYAQIGIPSGQLNGFDRIQNLRAGASPVTVTFVSSMPATGTLVTTAGAAATRTAQLTPLVYYTPTSVGTGGVAFRPLVAGQTSVSATAPGFTPMSTATRLATVQ